MLHRVARVLRDELSGFHLRLLLARLLLWPFPIYTANRLRVLILRSTGFTIGAKTAFAGTPMFTGGRDLYRNLKIGERCWFNVDCFFDLGESITIGNGVSMGHQVLILTSSHEVGSGQNRAATWYAKPVSIGNGAWLGARCTIMPGVVIGEGAVVAAGALVKSNVPPHAVVAGVPATILKTLCEDSAATVLSDDLQRIRSIPRTRVPHHGKN
jgi:maltose O-acetyltransferase